MNRQLRRAQEKADRKAAKEKAKAKAERQAKRYLRQQRRAERKRVRTSAPPRRSFMLPLWLTIVFTLFSAFTIFIQALAPSDDGALNTFVRIAYYFLFPYFLYAWLAKVNVARALAISIGVGLTLTLLSGALQWAVAEVTPDMVLLAIGIPITVLGAYLGRVVMRHSG